MAAGCASVPDAQERQARKAQAGQSADAARESYRRGHGIATNPDTPEDDFLARHLAVEQAVSGAPLSAGNRVRLLADGPTTYRAMLQSIGQARRYVHMETYIFDDDAEGARFAEALIAARNRGAEVSLMVDAVGTIKTPDALFQRLRDAGVQVAVFNPVNPVVARAGWSPNQRNHRKVLVVDGKVGYLGGINVSSVYESSPGSASGSGLGLGGGSGAKQTGQNDAKAEGDAKAAPWRDTHLRIEGPAVAQLEQVIQAGWASQSDEPIKGGGTYVAPPVGSTTVRILANQPDRSDGYTVYLTLMSAFESAQKSIHITMAYFVPDPAFIDVLSAAALRGVDVVLVLPGFSDSSLVFHAGRSHYADLLDAGVKLYERRDALLHAKTAVVDGVWSTVGSSNMDWRSFALNYEVNAVVLGPEFATEMEALFQRDVADSVPITPEAWRQRGVDDRFMETFSRMFERWL
ncbi:MULTISPECIES: phospholipase D-like domain-containing protein [Achromobacter]|uniref:Phospholipase D-like domain-containing protein n=1 Tax=Achromobacter spanius TaxID=217203 RepID=A0ABY8H2D7_9BURK|nr:MULTISPECIES: phospholipase D-like domain-containing protein [Achromobacter]WAI86461.1 phospholipase D-like domain-containing protein [Achromobacter spanius]WEX97454.1 phospholipase D-like domain-containing protein [Achromobacter sp. SS2-2022]WFP11241.1 phospholipase D-like domain-containing protein [Achromobacter spanius]